MSRAKAFLSDARIYLRALEENDAMGNYAHWLNDLEVCRFNTHHVFPYTQKDALEYIQSIAKNRSTLVLAIVLHEGDIHIGNISLQGINHLQQTADLAFLLGEKEHWGKGYSREAGQLLIAHGFNALNLRRITCGTSQDNLPMQRLAEKLGFKREGVRREALFKNGQYVDIIEYGLLRSEWTQLSVHI